MTRSNVSDDAPDEVRKRGLRRMSEVYGWEVSDGPGDYFAHTADQVFGNVWAREGLSDRDRRLILLGALAASNNIDVAEIQAGGRSGQRRADARTARGDQSLSLLLHRLAPQGTKMHFMFGEVIKKYRKQK